MKGVALWEKSRGGRESKRRLSLTPLLFGLPGIFWLFGIRLSLCCATWAEGGGGEGAGCVVKLNRFGLNSLTWS